jgi:hypothetical protein
MTDIYLPGREVLEEEDARRVSSTGTEMYMSRHPFFSALPKTTPPSQKRQLISAYNKQRHETFCAYGKTMFDSIKEQQITDNNNFISFPEKDTLFGSMTYDSLVGNETYLLYVNIPFVILQ